MLLTIVFALASTAILFSLVAMIFAFFAWSTVVGLKNSTHKIQYIPVQEPSFEEFGTKDLSPKIDPDSGEPLPPLDESTGAGLLKQFQDHFIKES